MLRQNTMQLDVVMDYKAEAEQIKQLLGTALVQMVR